MNRKKKNNKMKYSITNFEVSCAFKNSHDV